MITLEQDQTAFQMGGQAFAEGKTIEQNPNLPGMRGYGPWRAGWLEAKDDALREESGALQTADVPKLELGHESARDPKALTNPESPVYVLYHASCADGFAAAFVCWLVFGESARYIPVQYGQPMPEIPNYSRVFIVDFSFSEAELLALATRSQMVQVIDHHKTAVANLAGLCNDGCDHRFFKTFDMEHSGAVLTWLHFFPEDTVPELLLYVEDRDLGRMWGETPMLFSREINAALALEPFDFQRWRQIVASENMKPLVAAGATALKLIEQTAKRAAKKAVLSQVGFYSVPVVNCTVFISETCHEMLALHPEAKFVASYFIDERGMMVWSLRSRADFDVSEVARKLGGGGHPQAAGFTCNPRHSYGLN